MSTVLDGLYSRIESAARVAGCSVGDVLSTLARPTIRARDGHKFCIVDYATVEARAVAWLANERQLLESFRDPARDVYCDFGRAIFGQPLAKTDPRRAICKICVLGLGYGMGSARFDNYARLNRIQLAAHGLTAEKCVSAFRKANFRLTRFWYDLERAAKRTTQDGGYVAKIGRVYFGRDDGHLQITLPSGRQLLYRDCMVQPPLDQLRYTAPRGHRTGLYGALLAENLSQAVSADFLREGLIEFQDTAVMHVHDEIVCEVPEKYAEEHLHRMGRFLSAPPVWAPGFPLRVEGFTNQYYSKKPARGEIKIDYQEGKSL